MSGPMCNGRYKCCEQRKYTGQMTKSSKNLILKIGLYQKRQCPLQDCPLSCRLGGTQLDRKFTHRGLHVRDKEDFSHFYADIIFNLKKVLSISHFFFLSQGSCRRLSLCKWSGVPGFFLFFFCAFRAPSR